MTQNKKTNSGFSLIELSIVLTILAVVTYGTISAGSLQIEMANTRQTSDHHLTTPQPVMIYCPEGHEHRQYVWGTAMYCEQ